MTYYDVHLVLYDYKTVEYRHKTLEQVGYMISSFANRGVMVKTINIKKEVV